METILKFIEWARLQPESVRQRIFVVAVGLTLIAVFLIWAFSLRFVDLAPGDRVNKRETVKQESHSLSNDMRSRLPSIRQFVSDIFQKGK